MTLDSLIEHAIDKTRFVRYVDYIDFGKRYLDFIETGVQAVILAQNERHYQFIQYKDDGHRNITRPLNALLMLDAAHFDSFARDFSALLRALKDRERPDPAGGPVLARMIYTLQQAIGATLDALPAGASNQARKINGDLFERLIRLLIEAIGLDCTTGIVKVPIRDDNGAELFKASYQHDLLIRDGEELRIIGSVKTSSKDRIDKIFLDKFLYGRLTETAIPHVAIFLNDVQRAQRRGTSLQSPTYRVAGTFLAGHFKAYTVKLNPLDGVYYCDLRPAMATDPLLRQHIRPIGHFFLDDLWKLLGQPKGGLSGVEIEEGLAG